MGCVNIILETFRLFQDLHAPWFLLHVLKDRKMNISILLKSIYEALFFVSARREKRFPDLLFVCVCACVSVYLVSTMLLQLLVELEGDADHHFGLVPVGVGDVVQDAIEI